MNPAFLIRVNQTTFIVVPRIVYQESGKTVSFRKCSAYLYMQPHVCVTNSIMQLVALCIRIVFIAHVGFSTCLCSASTLSRQNRRPGPTMSL